MRLLLVHCPSLWNITFRGVLARTIMPLKFASKFAVSFPVCLHQGAQPGGGSIQTIHSAFPRTMSWICPGQTREDGGYWPFPVRSCQTASAGSAAAMAGLGDGSDGIGGPGIIERFRDAAGESPVRPRSRVYGRLLRRRPGGGGSAAPAGSWHQPRQHRRSDSASPGTKFGASPQLLKTTSVSQFVRPPPSRSAAADASHRNASDPQRTSGELSISGIQRWNCTLGVSLDISVVFNLVAFTSGDLIVSGLVFERPSSCVCGLCVGLLSCCW